MKKLLVLLTVAALVIAMAVSTAAIDLPEGDILGHWKLDGDLTNAAGGEDAEWIGYQFAEPLWDPDEYSWIEGVDGSGWLSDGNDGIKFPVPKDNNLTAMLWVKTNSIPFATPFLWWGVQDQSATGPFGGETWTGVWPGLSQDLAEFGPCIGSNNPSSTRVAVLPTENSFSGVELPWTHIAITLEYDEETNTNYGKLFYNGELVGEGAGLYAGWHEEANVYIGVNYWDHALNGYIDDVIIYNNVLADADIAAIYAQYETPSEEIVVLDAPADDEPTTDAPDDDEPATDAPDDDEPATTDAPADDSEPATTEAPEDKGGCGSVMGGAAVVIAALTATLGCAVIKRK